MLYDFKDIILLLLSQQKRKGKSIKNTIYIYGGGKYCTSIWHEREAIFMKHPEISQERNVHLKRENKGSMASTSMQLNKKLIFRF